MKELKLVSVIIPTFSRPDNLCRAIDSVLNQTYSPIEIIVVDDNGEGTVNQISTESILSNYINNKKIVYIKHKVNRNGSAARNTGLACSHGMYVNFLDDDDVILPNKISEQVRKLEREVKFGACYCNSLIIRPKHCRKTKNTKEGNLLIPLLSGKAEFNTSTLLFRREIITSLGGFDERFIRCQDWELMTRFFRNNSLGIVKDYLVKKYTTPNIVSSNPMKMVNSRKFFLQQFEKDIINSGGNKLIQKYFVETTALGLLICGEKKDGLKTFLKVFNYGIPSLMTFLKLLYYMIQKK